MGKSALKSIYLSNGHAELGRILFLLILSYFLFFYQAGERYLWSPDEDEYALVNREMVEDGHWIFPTANGQPYGIKPPLYNWIGSLFSLINGEVTEATSRLPSAIAATAGLIFLYLLGKALFGLRAGLLASLVLATSPLYIEFGRWIQINMMSTMLLTATLYLFYRGYTEEKRRNRAYLLMYIPMGFGTLNMGPVNVVMPAIVIALYLFKLKDLRHIFQLRIGWGILIYLIIVAPWYVAVALQEGYASDLFIKTNLTRFFGHFSHARPFYYYLTTVPPYFLPWLFFLPGAIIAYFSYLDPDEKRNFLFPLLWTVGLFVFFSLSRTKRSEYLLPIFPALALMVGFVIDRALLRWKDSPFWQKCITRPAYITLVIFIIGGLGLPVYAWLQAPDWIPIVAPITILTILCFVSGFIFLRKDRSYAAILTMVLFIVVVVAYGADAVVGKINDVNSARGFCLAINDRIPAGEKLKTFQFYRPVYAYYTHRFVENTEDPEQLRRWFSSDQRVFVVTKEKVYLEIKPAFPLPIYVVHRQWIDHRYVLLLSNRPDA